MSGTSLIASDAPVASDPTGPIPPGPEAEVTAYVYDTDDLSDSTASNAALTFKGGSLLRRWLFGPQTDEPLAFEEYTDTTRLQTH